MDFSSLQTTYIYKKCEKDTCHKQKVSFWLLPDK
jgi:hypothetical protein